MSTETANETPIGVHVVSIAAGAELGHAQPAQRGYRAHYETFVLTSNDPVQCILPEDADRLEAYVTSPDNDIVIGPRGVVIAPANTVTNTPNPQGTLVPHTLTAPFPVRDCNAVFAGVTTTATASRVSVAAYYRA